MGIVATSIFAFVSTVGADVAATATGIAGAVAADFGATIPGWLGAGIGAGAEGAVFGAGLGTVEGLATHGNIGQDALLGGLTGGAIGGFGPALGGLTGLGTTAGDALAGAGAGALGAELTHQNPLTGALEGGASGLVSGLLSGAGGAGAAPTTSAGGAGAGTISAAGTAAPASVPLSSPDLSLGGSLADTGAALTAAPDALTGAAGVGLDTGTGVAANAGVPSALDANLPGTVGAGAAAPGGTATPGLPDASVAPTPAAAPIDALSAGGTIAAPGGGNNIDIAAPTINGGIDAGTSINGGIQLGGATTAPAAPAGGGLGGLLNAKNLAPLLGAGSIGLDLLKGNQQPKYEAQLLAEANAAAAQGHLLQNYQTSGTLPPGMQSGINAAQDSAAAAIRSEYASRGDSVSSAESQDISNLGIRTQAQGEADAAALFQQGVSETGLSDQIYSELMNVQIQQDNALSSSIQNMVNSLAGLGRPVAAQAG